jgi:hypothetical protein
VDGAGERILNAVGRLPEPLRERLVEGLAALLVSDMERYPAHVQARLAVSLEQGPKENVTSETVARGAART